jgi:hypothetical protein
MKKFLLPAILLGFLLVASLHVSLSRSLFFDEAINLYIGKVLARGGSYESGMVGSLRVYPALVAEILKVLQANGVTGVALTRLAVPAVREVNVLFGALTVLFVYLAARRLWGRSGATWSAALFAATGCVIFTSGFATYDTLSLMFLTASVWLAIEATEDRHPAAQLFLLATSGLVLGLSVSAKYVSVAFVPGILAIIGIRKKWLGLVFLIASLAAAVIVIRAYGGEVISLLDYHGGHGESYGSTPVAILYEVIYFVGPLLVLGFIALGFLEKRWVLGFVLLGVSLITPLYHIAFNDPLALFKQMAWTAMFASLLAGVTLSKLERWRFAPVVLFAGMAAFGWYQVRTLEQFYPDLTEANRWLLTNVTSEECHILVDDAWTVRWELNITFDTKEYCVADEWRFKHELTTPSDLIGNVYSGVYPYIVYEEGGMFNGKGAVFNDDVIRAVQTSGRYQLVAEFPSFVTWGNAVLPPEFSGSLQPNSSVTILVWRRR